MWSAISIFGEINLIFLQGEFQIPTTDIRRGFNTSERYLWPFVVWLGVCLTFCFKIHRWFYIEFREHVLQHAWRVLASLGDEDDRGGGRWSASLSPDAAHCQSPTTLSTVDTESKRKYSNKVFRFNFVFSFLLPVWQVWKDWFLSFLSDGLKEKVETVS